MPKIEIIKQQDLKDCGACALECIIKYYGGYVPLEKIRDDTCTTINGTNALNIVEAAKNYGFEANGFKAKTIDDDNLFFPAIAHVLLKNGLQHFVVVYKVGLKDIWLMDPNKGKIKISREEFNDMWDNIILTFSPVSDIPTYREGSSFLNLMIKLIKQNKLLFVSICLITILVTIFTIINGFYLQIMVSNLNNGTYSEYVKYLIMIFLTITVLKVVLTFCQNYYTNYLLKNIDANLFYDILDHIFHLPLKFIQNRTTGEIVSRVQELSEIKNFIADFFTTVFLNSILVLASGIALYFLNRELLLFLLLVIFTYALVCFFTNSFIKHKINDNIETSTDFNSTLIENIDLNSSIKSLNVTESFFKRIETSLIKMLKSTFNTNNLVNILEFIKNSIEEIGIFVVMSYGIYLVYTGDLEVLSLVTFNTILYYMLNPIKNMLSLLPRLNYLKLSFTKLKDFLNVDPEDEYTGLKKLENGSVTFSDVTYSYNSFTNVLKNVTFEIKKGEKALLTGPSGCGKSTVCHLLLNNNSEYGGVIKVNDVSIHDYSLNSIRDAITYVGQNEELFTGTIKENIICKRDYSESDYLDICKLCLIDEIAHKRPNSYETLINASINNLSGGEKQRVILARSLLKKSEIIILDEALSEVSLDMEVTIINNIKKYFKDQTIIYISHKNVESEFERIIKVGET